MVQEQRAAVGESETPSSRLGSVASPLSGAEDVNVDRAILGTTVGASGTTRLHKGLIMSCTTAHQQAVLYREYSRWSDLKVMLRYSSMMSRILSAHL